MARNFELELAKATFQVDTLLCRRDIGESFQPEGSTVGSKHPLGLFWLCWSDRKWHNVLLNHIVLSGVCFWVDLIFSEKKESRRTMLGKNQWVTAKNIVKKHKNAI